MGEMGHYAAGRVEDVDEDGTGGVAIRRIGGVAFFEEERG